MFDILQLNGHKSKSVSANLVNSLFTEKGRQIGLLQEPYCFKGKPACLGRSLQIFSGGGDPPRAAIVATRGAPLWFLEKFSGPDVTTVLLKTGRECIYLCSVYLDINHQGNTFFPDKFLSLIKKCSRENKKVIIGMDSNCLLYTSPSPRDRG